MALMNLYINTTRNICKVGDHTRRRTEARRTVKLLLAPHDAERIFSDGMVPDHLVSEPMIDRFLEIEPPQARGTIDFDTVIEEIERSYVLGLFFSALSASVVTIERMLNSARIELHSLSSPKIPSLWNKESTNEWRPNIEALASWKYLSETLAKELPEIYQIRCRYLHSGDISTVGADSLRTVRAAYSLLGEIIGFPPRLFRYGNFGIECLDDSDPLVRAFYTPRLTGSSPEVA
jgi:hypothetical protein